MRLVPWISPGAVFECESCGIQEDEEDLEEGERKANPHWQQVQREFADDAKYSLHLDPGMYWSDADRGEDDDDE
jgi:hypothetical protein